GVIRKRGRHPRRLVVPPSPEGILEQNESGAGLCPRLALVTDLHFVGRSPGPGTPDAMLERGAFGGHETIAKETQDRVSHVQVLIVEGPFKVESRRDSLLRFAL